MRRTQIPIRLTPLVAIATLSAAVGMTGCGSSSSPSGDQSALQSATTATTSYSEGSTSTQVLPPPLSAPVATWRFTWPVEGGYRYSATLALSAPEHINDQVIAPCTAEETAAQVRGKVELKNETKGFNGQPIIDLETTAAQAGEPNAIMFGGSNCEPEGEGQDAVEYHSNEALKSGASVGFGVAWIVPSYYSPEHPSGDPSRLDGYSFKAIALKSEGSDLGTGPVQIHGPDIKSFGPETMQEFSLGAVGR
jgi:hypothetical protein